MAYRNYRRSSRSNRSRYRKGSQREPIWVRYEQKAIPAVGTAGSHPVDLLPDGLIDHGAVVGATVTRVRGSFEVFSSLPSSYFSGFYVGFAILDRSAEPLEDLPEPYANANDVQWMYWEWLSVARLFATTVYTSGAPVEYAISLPFDVKSQRKIRTPQSTLIGIIQAVSFTSTPTPPSYNLMASTLLKLS